MSLTISPLTQEDIPAAADVIATVFTEKWRTPALTEFTRLFRGEAHPTYIFVARVDNEIVGVAGCLETFFAEFVYGLCWVGVLESHRRQGIARQLIERIEQFIKIDLLQGKPGTLILATDGPDYYERMGFATQPTRLHDSAALMLKVI